MEIKSVPPKRKDERDYEREMSEEYLQPFLLAVGAAVAATDGSTGAWVAAVAATVARWDREMSVRFPRQVVERWAEKATAAHTNAFVRSFARGAGVDLRPFMNDDRVKDHIRDVINQNVSLIETIPQRFKDGLGDKLAKAESIAPLDLTDRERLFRREGKSAGYNLRRITRDQTTKLTGALNEIRQTDAGIYEYRWSTSEDDRVRPTHESKNNDIFSWADPPADTGHPGHDIQCRCIAIPHITLDEVRSRFGR